MLPKYSNLHCILISYGLSLMDNRFHALLLWQKKLTIVMAAVNHSIQNLYYKQTVLVCVEVGA